MQPHITIHPDLLAAEKYAYTVIGLSSSNYIQEMESQEYGACDFELNNAHIKFRVAKITPTKIGQFATFWKRINNGPIKPYDVHDPFDFLIVSVRSKQNFGQFIFPKNILCQQGLLSRNHIGGKRAMRIYPPWDATENSQAKKTQAWQLKYFVEIQPNFDAEKMRTLLT